MPQLPPILVISYLSSATLTRPFGCEKLKWGTIWKMSPSICHPVASSWYLKKTVELTIFHMDLAHAKVMEIISIKLRIWRAFLVAQTIKNLPAMQETWVWSLGGEDPLEKEMATHSSILVWRIPWTEEPGGLQSTGSQRVGLDWVTSLSLSLLNEQGKIPEKISEVEMSSKNNSK